MSRSLNVLRNRFALSLPILLSTTFALPAAAAEQEKSDAQSSAAPAMDKAATDEAASASKRPTGTHGPREGSVGLSLGLPAGGGPTIGASYNLSDRSSLRMDFGLEIASAGSGGATQTRQNSEVLFGFSIDAGYRMYLWNAGSLHAFVQPGLFFSKRAQPGDFGALSTLAAVGTIGAEYFVVDQFSVSGATGLSLALSNEFQDVRFSTGTTALYANFYW